jgi:methyl-accepting chemotaxis protein
VTPTTRPTADSSTHVEDRFVASASASRRDRHAKRGWLLGQRRRFLIDRRSQLRTTLLTAAVVATVLAALLVSLHLSREKATDALVTEMPLLAPTLAAQNRTDFAFQLAGAIVFLVMVVVVTILETHKTAGAAFNLERQLGRIRDGEYGVRVTLRHNDNLQGVGRAFNEMSIALDERLWETAETLDELAEQAKRISNPDEARQLAEVLSEHASARRRATGFASEDGRDLPVAATTDDRDRVEASAG